MISKRARVMAVAGLAASSVASVVLAQCPGLSPSVEYGLSDNSSFTRSLAYGDIDGDGDVDVVLANAGASLADFNLRVLLNGGAGTFTAGESYTAGQRTVQVELADIDGDGDLDIVAGSSLSFSNQVTIRLNNGNGTFGPRVQYDTGDGGAWSFGLGDLDGDGDLDIVTQQVEFPGRVMLNNGNGTFTIGASVQYGANVVAGTLADIDGDGNLDVVAVGSLTDNALFLRNNGNATFAPPVAFATGDGPNAIDTGDLDGDGDVDVVVSNGTGTISILRNNGNGTFAPAVNLSVGTSPSSIRIDDVDGDGDQDIAVGYNQGNFVSLLRNSGTGIFAQRTDFTTPGSPWFATMGDIDADGDLDVLAATSTIDGPTATSSLSVLRNEGFFVPSIQTQPVHANVCPGNNATFSVVAGGPGPFLYQWRRSGVPIRGAMSATLSIQGVTEADIALYDVIVTNGCGSTVSAGAALIVGGSGCAGPCPADFNQDGGIDGSDLGAFIAAWEGGC